MPTQQNLIPSTHQHNEIRQSERYLEGTEYPPNLSFLVYSIQAFNKFELQFSDIFFSITQEMETKILQDRCLSVHMLVIQLILVQEREVCGPSLLQPDCA